MVAVIANQLVSQGCKPEEISAGAIRDETKTGSLTTIIAHLKNWRAQERPVVPGVTLDLDSLSGVTSEVTALIEQACERVRLECRTAAVGDAVEKTNLRAELDEALRVNEQIEVEREALASEVKPLKTALDEARFLVADLKGQIKGQARALAVLKRSPANLSPDDAGAGRSKVELSGLPADPAILGVQAGGDGGIVLAEWVADALAKQRRSLGDGGGDVDHAVEKVLPSAQAANAICCQLELPLIPSDDTVQACFNREEGD